MNTLKKGAVSVLTGALFFLAGCKEITTTTIVHKDKSITRMIEVPGDSNITNQIVYPVPNGPGWEKVHESETVDGERKELWTMTRHYKTASEMIQEFAELSKEKGKIQLNPNVRKKNRWFYSYYHYTEKIGSYNMFSIPVTDYVSIEELITLSAEDSTSDQAVIKDIKSRYEQWEKHAFLDVLIQALKKEMINTNMITEDQFEQKKNILLENLTTSLESDDEDLSFDTRTFLKISSQSLEIPAVKQLEPLLESVWEDVEFRLGFMQQVESDHYIFRAEMPGIIVKTNADGIEGNRVYWQVHHYLFLAEDYSLEAVSKIPNTKALIFSGILALAALTILIMPLVRKRH